MNQYIQSRWCQRSLGFCLVVSGMLSACTNTASIKTPSEVTLLINLVPTPTPPPTPPTPPPPSPPPTPPTPIPTTPLPTPTSSNIAPGLRNCTVDVGRSADTAHPASALNDFVNNVNDQVRAITGLPIDIFVGEGGGKYVVDCRLPPGVSKAAVLDPNTGAAIARLHQMRGMPLRNYFAREDLLRPGKNEALKKPLQLLPVPGEDPPVNGASPSLSFDTSLPPPAFSFNYPTQAVPDLAMNIGVGQYIYSPAGAESILTVAMQFDAQPGKAANATTDNLHVVMRGKMAPDVCVMIGDSCSPEQRASNFQDRHIDPQVDILEPLKALVAAKKANNEPITQDIFDELFTKTTWDTDNWEHVQFRMEGASLHLLSTNIVQETRGGACSLIIDRGGELPNGWRANAGLALLCSLTITAMFRVRRALS